MANEDPALDVFERLTLLIEQVDLKLGRMLSLATAMRTGGTPDAAMLQKLNDILGKGTAAGASKPLPTGNKPGSPMPVTIAAMSPQVANAMAARMGAAGHRPNPITPVTPQQGMAARLGAAGAKPLPDKEPKSWWDRAKQMAGMEVRHAGRGWWKSETKRYDSIGGSRANRLESLRGAWNSMLASGQSAGEGNSLAGMGNAMQSVGNLASMAPLPVPFRIAAKAVGELGNATFQTIDKVKKWGDAVQQANFRFADSSPAMAGVRARDEVRQLLRDMQRGNAQADSAERLSQSRDWAERQWAPIESAWDRLMNNVAAGLQYARGSVPSVTGTVVNAATFTGGAPGGGVGTQILNLLTMWYNSTQTSEFDPNQSFAAMAGEVAEAVRRGQDVPDRWR